jgi:V8-like Glu-specific endopeptidase
MFDKTSTDYLGVMASLCPVLYGNVTVLQYDCDIEGGVTGKCYLLRRSSSQVLQTGLGACGAFGRSWWSKNMDKLNATHQKEFDYFCECAQGVVVPEWECGGGVGGFGC